MVDISNLVRYHNENNHIIGKNDLINQIITSCRYKNGECVLQQNKNRVKETKILCEKMIFK